MKFLTTQQLSEKIDLTQSKSAIGKNIIKNLSAPKIIGLSGASGFLGLHLLKELSVDDSVLHIKCFIRDFEKFKAKKALFKLDFSQEKMSFHTDFEPVAFADITNFIHSAAQLHNLKTAEQLWSDNVVLTQKLLALNQGRFHYISTLSVFASSNKSGSHLPQYVYPDNNHRLYGGYAQTKWIGEYLAMQNQSQIFRLGLLTPALPNPYFQEHEFFHLFLKLLKKLGVHPANYEEAFVDISPVDLVARKIVRHLDDLSPIIHLAANKATSLSAILEHAHTKEVSQDIWLNLVKDLKKTEKILLMYAFFKSRALEQYPEYYNIDLFQSTNHDWHGDVDSGNIVKSYVDKFNTGEINV